MSKLKIYVDESGIEKEVMSENGRVIECSVCGAEMILDSGYLSCPMYLDGQTAADDEHDSYEVEIIGKNKKEE